MSTRNVVLTDRQEAMIADLVESGRYQNASEVVREGLRLIERREAEDAAKLHTLREAAQHGLRSLERGEGRQFADGDGLAEYLDDLADEILGRKPGA
ncbi:type II toxin-antitoxin system ParD family antitoxin [Phenylobacterium aquaticum]|uniref:type II toxin-antitoxin system ParD family antitoxin n=1 Tax=Phenylobacterium aquaticum TaxID=1763816 RepID=UPI0026EB4FF5|nr:type II toxin-antitoxin system ParD family antitoxin [Phenylobacterium aquaticum]